MIRPSTTTALVAIATALPAVAQEVCVQCEGPAAIYRCGVGDIDKVGLFPGRNKAIEYVCITQLAHQGRHERCRVARDIGNVCLGDQRTVSWTAIKSEDGKPSDAVAERAPAAPEAAKSEPPRTLVEAARKTVEETKTTAKKAGEQFEQAGDVVGGAVKKTWKCLVSLFASC